MGIGNLNTHFIVYIDAFAPGGSDKSILTKEPLDFNERDFPGPFFSNDKILRMDQTKSTVLMAEFSDNCGGVAEGLIDCCNPTKVFQRGIFTRSLRD